MLSTAHTRTASFVLIVSAMIFTAYEAPLLTYVAFRTGLFDRAITNTTGVSVTLNSGWTLSPFTAWEILMGREPITGVVYFPLQFVYPWRSNEYVGVDRIKSPSIINGPKLHSLGKEVQIAGRKYFLISKSEGLAMTIAYSPTLGIELRAPFAETFSRAIKSVSQPMELDVSRAQNP